MLSAIERILFDLEKNNIRIGVIDGQIQLDVPKGIDVSSILEEIKSQKEQLILHLKRNKNISDSNASLWHNFDAKNLEHSIKIHGRRYFETFFRQQSEYIRYKVTNKTNVNIVFSLEFENINFPALEKTLITVFERHESLRTLYRFIDNIPMQYVLDKFELPIKYFDIGKNDNRSSEYFKIFGKAINKSFDFETQLPAYLTLVSHSWNKSSLIFSISHANSDYNCIAILKREIVKLYNAYKSNKENPLPELNVQYRHYAQWINSILSSDAGYQTRNSYLAKVKKSLSGSKSEGLEGFLKNRATGYTEQLKNELKEFSFEKQNEIEKIAPGKIVNLKFKKGGRYSMALEVGLFKELKDVSIQYRVSIFVLLLSSLAITFNKIAQKNHIRISVDFSTRVIEEFEPIIGWLTSDVIMCLDMAPNLSLEEFLQYVSKEFFAFSEYRFFPHEEILKDLDINLDMLAPLFINYIKYSKHISNDIRLGHEEENLGYFNLGMTINEYKNTVILVLRYDSDTYSKNSIEEFAILFKENLNKMVEHKRKTNFSQN